MEFAVKQRFGCVGLLGLALFLLVPLCSAENITDALAHGFPTYTVLDYRQGNFTNSGKEEYVVFMEKKDKDKEITVTLIDKVCVAIVNDNRIERVYEIKGLNGISGLDHSELEVAADKKVNWGGWNGFCCVRDFNGNGLDEILFFQLTGMSFLPYVFEYHDGEIKLILDPPQTYSEIIKRFEAIEQGNERYIMIWGWGVDDKNVNDPNGKRDWYKYVWNAKIGKYQIVDKGIQ